MASKDELYDEQIRPLVDQLIEICTANKMSFLMSFALGLTDSGIALCTSIQLDKDDHVPKDMVIAAQILQR